MATKKHPWNIRLSTNNVRCFPLPNVFDLVFGEGAELIKHLTAVDTDFSLEFFQLSVGNSQPSMLMIHLLIHYLRV